MPTLNWLTQKDDIKASGQVPYRILESVEKAFMASRTCIKLSSAILDTIIR